jgi:hypothetical protein
VARTLAATVHVRDPEDGRVRSFLAGDEPPDWAADQVTNPAAWAGGDTQEAPRAAAVPQGEGDAELAADVRLLQNGVDSTVAGWLADASIKRILAALDALDEQDRPGTAAVLADMEAARPEPRSSLLDRLGSYSRGG